MSSGIFWSVLTSLLLFLALPALLNCGWSYWPALGAAYAAALRCFGVTF